MYSGKLTIFPFLASFCCPIPLFPTWPCKLKIYSPNSVSAFFGVMLSTGISWGDRNCKKFYTVKLGLKSRYKGPADCHTFKHSFIRKLTTVPLWDRIFCYAKSKSSCYWLAAFPTATQNAILNTHAREFSLCGKCRSSVQVKRSDLYSIPHSLAICSQCFLYHHKLTRERLQH